ncbi:MAG: hypothetical protein HZY73_12350 [Micropruina sp.]|nr:MAG: hypothetical protein HZY73_12350 [Micropruina sp.]
MRSLFNNAADPQTLVPARGRVRRLAQDGSNELDYPEGTTPARGEVRIIHNDAGGVILLTDPASNPRLTGRVARLFTTGELRLAGPTALAKFVTTELADQWDEPDPAA